MDIGSGPAWALATALLTGPLVGDLAADGCRGCRGKTNHADSALATCYQSPLADWQLSASYEVNTGSCTSHTSGTTVTCEAEPCSGTVTWSWGAEIAGGIQEVGYQQARPDPQPRTTLDFGPEPPWTPGQGGSVAFGPEASPALACGTVWDFFIEADVCGPMKASVWASCTACGLSLPQGQ